MNELIIVCNSIHIYLYSTFHDALLQSSFTENEHFYITFSSLQHKSICDTKQEHRGIHFLFFLLTSVPESTVISVISDIIAVFSALELFWTKCLNAFTFWILRHSRSLPADLIAKKLLLFIFIMFFFFVKIDWFKLFYYSALGWTPGYRSVSGQ